ncbi:MAG TPA: cation:proton antiporter [Candidatus Limnocylindrales bacterium]
MTDTAFLVTLALALIVATIGAAIAVRLGQSAILGYVAAGVLIGPYTAGPIADAHTVAALADVGLVFLLFAVGLELSIRDLLRVRRIAFAGGLIQVAASVVMGYAVALALGFKPIEALFFGAFISQSSSTVIAKILGDRGELDSQHGHIALGWTVLQDLSTVVLVVLLTALSEGGDLTIDVAIATAKAVLFLVVLVPVGLYVLPRLFERIALLRSREVFVLTVVAVALGTAYVSELFGLSLALGAFLAGLLIGESDISHQISSELGPLRDVFAGVFFVSIGMLFNPAFVLAAAGLVAVAVFLIVPVKATLVAGLSRLLGAPTRSAILAGVVLAEAGEFSFLLARLGASQGAVGDVMFSLMLAAAAVSIVVAPWLARYAPGALREIDRRRPITAEEAMPVAPTESARAPRRFAVLCGYGRVGRLVGAALERRGFPFVVIEADPRICRELRARGVPVIQGLAENERNLDRVEFQRAQVVVVTLPDAVALRQVVHHVRREHPRVPIVARARSASDREMLEREGAGEIVVAETEVALEMARFTLGRLGVSGPETAAIVQGLRRRTATKT